MTLTKVIKNKDWILDIPKTEAWLNELSAQGLVLKSANLKNGKFVFEQAQSHAVYYKINYKKGGISPTDYANEGYSEVCRFGSFTVLKTSEIPQLNPSFHALLDQTNGRKYVIGASLLIYALFFSAIFLIIFIFALVDLIKGNMEIAVFIVLCIFLAVFSIPVWILTAKYKRLLKINKSLEELCGYNLDLSYTVPRDTILSKDEVRLLKMEGRYTKKIRLAWHYSPDLLELWLEKMEQRGYNLVRVGKLGITFYFVKGEPRKIKYRADYQIKINPEYYNVHKESGWKLFFTTSKKPCCCIWGQEYTDTPPIFYDDENGRLRYAKKLALFTVVMMIVAGFLFAIIVILTIVNFIKSSDIKELLLTSTVTVSILMSQYFLITSKSISFYHREKKSADKK